MSSKEKNKGSGFNTLPLEQIYLDPNNYRFRDHSDYVMISEDRISDEVIQQRTRSFLAGGERSRRGVQDLITSMKKVGYQIVERIKVKYLDENKYLVIEGNRRITALNFLKEDYSKNLDIGQLDAKIFKNIPVDITTSLGNHEYYLLAGLNHIGGKRKWPAINIATYIRDLVNNENWIIEEVCETFGITKQQYVSYTRALNLIGLYKDSEYGDQFTSGKFFIFEEIVKKPSIRDYFLKWDRLNDLPTDIENQSRLFAWLSYSHEHYDPDNPESDIVEIPPIINQGRDVRELDKIIKDPKALKVMEDHGMTNAILGSDKVKKSQLNDAINKIDKNIRDIAKHEMQIKDNDRMKMISLIEQLDLLTAKDDFKRQVINPEEQKTVLFDFKDVDSIHFSEISIDDYKCFKSVNFKGLNKINVIAGGNNSGKSTFLEAISILTNQNDLFSYYNLIRRRGKFNPDKMSPLFLDSETPELIKISGVYDSVNCGVDIIKTYENIEDYNKQEYITTLESNSFYGSHKSSSAVRFYENGDLRSSYEELKSICNLTYSSPFSFHEPENIVRLYDKAVKAKLDEQIIDFIKESGLGDDITGIKLTNYLDIWRFVVQQRKKETFDLTSFGDGMQRVFYIALHFAAAENGIVLIDEFENAIHYSLLIRYSSFIQRLANAFNVQVFLTTHSKECLDAFVNNDIDNDQISFFSVNESSKKNKSYQAIDGLDYQRMLDLSFLDIR
jgi:AAA15 family ATPase/GTPase